MSDPIQLLVSCCNQDGGLYRLVYRYNSDINKSEISYQKLLNGDIRGVAKYDDKYLIVENHLGRLALYDKSFSLLQRANIAHLEAHGIAIFGHQAYVVETNRNTIGIYDLPSLIRVNEICLTPKNHDVNHINDIFIEGTTMYLSMFMLSGAESWRDSPAGPSGVVLSYSLEHPSSPTVLQSGLIQPHSVLRFNGELYYCDSGWFTVKHKDSVIFKGIGWTRGLAVQDKLIFTGQSMIRSTRYLPSAITNVSSECGIYYFHTDTKMCKFVHLPSTEVYSIVADEPIS